jgi:hypothetical protein
VQLRGLFVIHRPLFPTGKHSSPDFRRQREISYWPLR